MKISRDIQLPFPSKLFDSSSLLQDSLPRKYIVLKKFYYERNTIQIDISQTKNEPCFQIQKLKKFKTHFEYDRKLNEKKI